MNNIDITNRQRRKLQVELKRMQAMWIEPHRMTDAQIEGLSIPELVRSIHAHQEHWSKFTAKPTIPQVCVICKREMGKLELKAGDKCFDCTKGDGWWKN